MCTLRGSALALGLAGAHVPRKTRAAVNLCLALSRNLCLSSSLDSMSCFNVCHEDDGAMTRRRIINDKRSGTAFGHNAPGATPETNLVHFGGSTNTAGIGAVFGVAECGAVFFNTAVPGSSCWEALEHEQIAHGDVLFSVNGLALYR